MRRILSIIAGSFAFLGLSLVGSQAATVTLNFSGLPNGIGICGTTFPPTYVEQGVTVSNCPAYYNLPGALHLDDSGTSLSNSATFTAGSPFSVLGLQLISAGGGFHTPTGPGGSFVVTPYNNVLFQGWQGSTQVASMYYSTGVTDGATSNVTFDSSFSNLTKFTITQVQPSAAEFAAGGTGSYCDAPCGHVNVDNVQMAIGISPVPLPASLPVFAAALLGLGALSRRRFI